MGVGGRDGGLMAQKITKKQQKAKRSIIVQKSRVQKIEDVLVNVDPLILPIAHHFTDNDQQDMNVCCRDFFMPANTLLTGTIYKIEMFMVLVQGKMRVVEGDHYRDIEAPCLMKNVVGQKNSWVAFEDCRIYGFIPNPDNTRAIHEIVNIFSELPAEEIQGMGANKQEMNHQKRIDQLC